MTIADVIARFPNENETTITDTFPLIENSLSCYYGGSFDNVCDREAILNLAMHLILVEGMNNSNTFRTVASQSVSGVSVSFAVPSTNNNQIGFFNSTKYGAKFLSLTSSNSGAYFI